MIDHPINLFASACGVSGPVQIRLTGPDGPEVAPLTLPQPFALIGSHSHTDVTLGHPQVSRRHAYLQVIGGRVFCVDLQSRTGLRWETRAGRTGWLDSGQSVSIGPYQVRPEVSALDNGPTCFEAPAGWNPLAVWLPGEDPLPEFCLEFLNGQTRQSLWPMRSTLALVGRLPGCQVRLVEPSVSRFHCSLLRTPLGLWVIDLLGREGVSANGERVRQAQLRDGDELQIGRFLIRVHYRTQSETVGCRSGSAIRTRELDGQSRPMLGGPPTPPGRRPVNGLVPLAEDHRAEKAEAADSFLVPIISQFNQMQQQMFDQFHQSVLMVVQMFSALHRDQMGLIREELDRLHQLTKELHALQTELIRRAPLAGDPHAEATAVVPPPPSLDNVAAELLARIKGMLAADQPPAAASVGNGHSSPPKAAAPAAEAPRPASPARRKAPASAADPAPLRPAAPAASTAGSEAGPSPQTNEEIHAWLHQRIAAIQHERESAWQRILNFMLGK